MTDYGTVRYEMGYASAMATVLFIVMLSMNSLISKVLSKYTAL
jgi:multiple sugar transport system permease protein